MAHKKAGGSSSNGRDSNPKYHGVKIFGGEQIHPGMIILRQRGSKFHPGNGVAMGRDFTIFAVREGMVKFRQYSKKRKTVSVV